MNISWRPTDQTFFAEFSDFQGDLDAIKAAGFRTTGPPEWRWYTSGIKALQKLRAHRPASGLTISPEALVIYQSLAQQEEANAEVKKQLTEQKKKLKKEQKQAEKESTESNWLPAGKEFLCAEDLALIPPVVSKFTPLPPPDLLCFVCESPVYFYEYEDIPMCLWCAKTSEK